MIPDRCSPDRPAVNVRRMLRELVRRTNTKRKVEAGSSPGGAGGGLMSFTIPLVMCPTAPVSGEE